MLTIGIGHRRGVGKDMTTKIMSTELKVKNPSKHIINVGFADPLYDTCEELYSWAGLKSREYYIEHWQAKKTVLPLVGKSPRQILIEMGMKVREIHEETWLRKCLSIKADVKFISDVRFPNEAQAIRDAGGLLFRIDRPNMERIEDPDDPDNKLQGWTDWDRVIHNDGSLRELSTKLKGILNETTFW